MNDIVSPHSPVYSLGEKLERCRTVECVSSMFFLASRTYGRQWTTLLRDPELAASSKVLSRVRTTRR